MQKNSSFTTIELEIKNSLVDPASNGDSIYFYKKDKTIFYKVWIYLEGRDLPYVDYVTWYLHESFAEPVRRIQRTPSNPNCTLVTWTWGTFKLRAVVVDKTGKTYTMERNLDWDRELTKDKKYIEERMLS